MSIQEQKQPKTTYDRSVPFVLPFTTIDASMLAQVGGKAANLGELAQAHFQVPPGFCVTTAAYQRAAEEARLESVLDQLASTPGTDLARLEAGAAEARRLLQA